MQFSVSLVLQSTQLDRRRRSVELEGRNQADMDMLKNSYVLIALLHTYFARRARPQYGRLINDDYDDYFH